VAARPYRLRPGGPAAAAALVVVLVGSALAWSVSAYDGHQQRRGEAAAATATVGTLERRAKAIAALIGGPVEGLAVLSPREIPAVLSVLPRPDSPPTVVSGVVPAGVDPVQVAALARTAMEVARDSGSPTAAPLLRGLVPVAVALLPRSTSPLSTLQRRAEGRGWRIALFSPEALVAGLPATRPRPVGLRIDGSPVGDVRNPETAGTVLIGGQPWTLYLARTTTPVSRGGLGVVAITLVGAVACLLAGVRMQAALGRERSAALSLERETRTVAGLGPLLQSSLDLAEVLPAVAVRLSDEFALSRFSVSLVGETGRLIDVFALGPRPAEGPSAVDASPAAREDLPAGVAGSLPLQRAGRTIGRLSFTGHRDLSQPQLVALSAAADLIAVATYNVELFEREQASVRRLRELDQLKDAFLSTISHELRTPLTAISGFVRLLRDRWDQIREDQRKEFLDRVHGNTLSLGLLVDDLLDFARLERQALNAPPTPMDLDQQVARTLAQLAPVLGDRELVTDLQPVRALGNAGALERVLANLLTNAVKFSPAGSRLTVTVCAASQSALLVVADEGAGIAPDERDQVFARFFRGNSDAARGTRGAGIGLSVVRELVHQMGGTVAAEGNTPRGTRMVVSLPLEHHGQNHSASPTVAPRHIERSSA
jgi:signal transduction histidine kinase